ncbi:MAG: OmpA family protein [Deltaproteobacteria bacterium]|nr:OmpA family protein [Deltaproteobacteria bacterium]
MSESGRVVIIKKVKKREYQYTHGGQWKVAYADFVTAMMAFFLLLWLIAVITPEKRAVLAEYFKSFTIFQDSSTSVIDGKAFVMEDLITRPEIRPEEFGNKFKRAVDEKLKDMKDQVLVDVIEGGVRIQIVDKEGNTMFPLGSAEPTPKAKEVLALIYENVKDMKQKIAIEGHTDSAPFRGDQITNWELATSRASAARRELEQHGIEPSRIARVVGYADQELLVKEDPRDPRNRRISIILLQEHQPATVIQKPLERDVKTGSEVTGQQAQNVPSEKVVVQSDPSKDVKSALIEQEKKSASTIKDTRNLKQKRPMQRRDMTGVWD